MLLAEFLQESNKIEGYDFPVGDYYDCLKGEYFGDNMHIRNSVEAIQYVIKNCKKPIGSYDILKLHCMQMTTLLPDHEVGTFRNRQIIAGGRNVPRPEVVYYHVDYFVHKFANAADISSLDLHYEFELIHPFIDGNGRVGRLLWVWHLLYKDCSIYPILDNYEFVLKIKMVLQTDFDALKSSYFDHIRDYKK